MNYSQLLLEKIDAIAKNWVKAVRLDRQISSADNLPRSAIRDHLTDVLKAMATVLDYCQDSDIESIVQNSLEHGVLRAAQGFTLPKIAREYRLLRWVIFSTLEDVLKVKLSQKSCELSNHNTCDRNLNKSLLSLWSAFIILT